MTSEPGRVIRCGFLRDFPMGIYNGVLPKKLTKSYQNVILCILLLIMYINGPW